MSQLTKRLLIRVTGIVQGVGFRPYVFNLAARHGLAGWIRNDSTGVQIEVEGPEAGIEAFIQDLRMRPPPIAKISSIETADTPPTGEPGFRIEASEAGERRAFISPDVATCDDCLRELFDPADRRYRYPFINCTNCGPRYTIVTDVPYDRPLTTMASFTMCHECKREYHDPSNRRFHAQPNACPLCGPQVRMFDDSGRPIEAADPVAAAVRLLRAGRILAVKGLGGYHLACDATNEKSVARLRSRKHREERPFALMAPDAASAAELCDLGAEDIRLLCSRRRPIVLAPRRSDARVAAAVAPRHTTLGVMLPYTPLHHLLLAGAQRPLVMTSGNLSDEPIAYLDPDASARLRGIADAFLVHDRQIHIRCDDSVTRVLAGAEAPSRRSRGYAPEPIGLPVVTPTPTAAVGAELKNTVALAKGNLCFVSHHVGDLENLETFRSFREAIEHLSRIFDVHYEAVAHDLHPEYLSTKWALSLDGVRRIPVQHHHAHIASCMAENGRTDPVIGVAFDGLGYGTDGTLWGGEFLVADLSGFDRAAHLALVPMPGGAQAIHQPWRMAVVWLERAFGDDEELMARLLPSIDARRRRNCLRMAARGVNAPLTSSMGRLFDAVGALVGLRAEVSYEAQAAIELEALVDPREAGAIGGYRFDVTETRDGRDVIDPAPCVRAVVSDRLDGVAAGTIASRFHQGVADMVLAEVERLASLTGIRTVALSGGVFQNAVLTSSLAAMLSEARFEVLLQRHVPGNDGGICLGQAAVAAAILSGKPSLATPARASARGREVGHS